MSIAKINVNLLVVFVKERNNCIVAYCPALELSAYGDSLSEAKYSFEQTFELFLEEIGEKGTLNEVLLGLGWTLKKVPSPEFSPPIFTESDIESFLPKYINPMILKTTQHRYAIPIN